MSGKGATSEAGAGVHAVDEILDWESEQEEVPVLPSTPTSPTLVANIAVPTTASSSTQALLAVIVEFSTRTGIQDPSRCASLLAASQWDLERALHRFLAAADEVPTAGVLGLLPSPSMGRRVAWNLATLPFKVIGGGVDTAIYFLRLGVWATCHLASSLGLLRRMARDLDGDVVLDAPRPRDLDVDIMLDIARRLRPSLRDINSVRSVSKHWRDAIPSTSSIKLVLSRPIGAQENQKIYILQMTSAGDGAGHRMEQVICISPPHEGSFCWGADHGLLALWPIGTDQLHLHCIVCGQMALLPPLSDDLLEPTGFFYNPYGFQSFATLSSRFRASRLHFEGIDFEAANPATWELYPGVDRYYMSSVAFAGGFRFVGVTSEGVVVDELGGPAGGKLHKLVMPDIMDHSLVIWQYNHRHVFECAGKVYICEMYRAYDDACNVSVAVFRLDKDPGAGYHLQRAHDIGDFSVYLGRNKALVLPAVNGSFGHQANTVYITDDDGLVRYSRVLVIGVGTGEVVRVDFPPGVSISDFQHASWVAPPSPGGPIFHCHAY